MNCRFDIRINKGTVALTPSSSKGRGIDGKIKRGFCSCRSYTIESQLLNKGSLINYINGQISSACSESEKKKYLLKKGWFFGCFGSSKQKIDEALKFLKDRSYPLPNICPPEGNTSQEIQVPVGKSFSIKLWHSPTTGHQPWEIAQLPSFIKYLDKSIKFQDLPPDVCGGGADYRFIFEPKKAGRGDIIMRLPCSFDASRTVEKKFTLVAD